MSASTCGLRRGMTSCTSGTTVSASVVTRRRSSARTFLTRSLETAFIWNVITVSERISIVCHLIIVVIIIIIIIIIVIIIIIIIINIIIF